jgi:quinol monooxygenase YgiN
VKRCGPQLYRVSAYIENIYRSNAFARQGDLSEWFALERMETSALIAKSNAWHDRNLLVAPSFSDDEELDDEDSEDRFFGRTVAFEPSSSDWIFVRFGAMPVSGVSRCGLIGDDLEDGPDAWKTELGNMTHEAGVCAFRAYRHPDHPGHLVLMEPFFEHARYGVPGQEAHLLSIMPEADDCEGIPALQLDGELKTIKGFDGSLRCELGSDGEYLVDVTAPVVVRPLDVSALWVTEKARVIDVLASARSHVFRR